MSTVTPKVGQTELEDRLASLREDILGEDQREEGLLGMRDMSNLLIVVAMTLTVLLMVAVLACIVGAVIYSVKCCTRRHQAELEIQTTSS